MGEDFFNHGKYFVTACMPGKYTRIVVWVDAVAKLVQLSTSDLQIYFGVHWFKNNQFMKKVIVMIQNLCSQATSADDWLCFKTKIFIVLVTIGIGVMEDWVKSVTAILFVSACGDWTIREPFKDFIMIYFCSQKLVTTPLWTKQLDRYLVLST